MTNIDLQLDLVKCELSKLVLTGDCHCSSSWNILPDILLKAALGTLQPKDQPVLSA